MKQPEDYGIIRKAKQEVVDFMKSRIMLCEDPKCPDRKECDVANQYIQTMYNFLDKAVDSLVDKKTP